MALTDFLNATQTGTTTYDPATTEALLVVYIVLGIILIVGSYLYLSFAYQSIARKTRIKPAGIAWIPSVGPLIIAAKASKRKTCPIWLLLIGAVFFAIAYIAPEITWLTTISLLISLVAFSILFVYSIIWHWHMFKTLKYPGWWSLFVLGSSMGAIIHMVLLGVAAWLEK